MLENCVHDRTQFSRPQVLTFRLVVFVSDRFLSDGLTARLRSAMYAPHPAASESGSGCAAAAGLGRRGQAAWQALAAGVHT